MNRDEDEFSIRPSPSIREFAQRQYIQKNAYEEQMANNLKRKKELENKQKLIEDYQREREKQNLDLMKKGAGFEGKVNNQKEVGGRDPYVGPQGSVFDPEEAEKHKQRLKLLRHGLHAVFDEGSQRVNSMDETRGTFDFGKKPNPEELAAREEELRNLNKPKMKYYDDEENEEEIDFETQKKMEEIRKQNENIKLHLESVRKEKTNKGKASKFKDELEKLNALESKMYDYNKHLENAKNMNRIGDDLTRMARNQALASIKAGQMRKDNMVKMAMDQASGGKDPWARKMLMRMMQAQMAGGMAGNSMVQQFQGSQTGKKIKDNSDSSSESSGKRSKKTNKKIKKMNEELEKNKQLLEELRGDKMEKGIGQNQMSKDEIQKIIDETVNKMKPEIQKKAKEVGAGPDDIVTLPNGVTIIKPKDPSKPPIFIMPEEPGKEIRKRMNRTGSSLSSSVSSIS